MAGSMAWASAVAFDDDGTFDTSSERYEHVSCSLKSRIPIVLAEGIKGNRSMYVERVQQGQIAIGGDIVLEPNPVELDLLLPRILGAVESTDVFAVADTLPTFWVLVDRIAKVHRYAGCYVSRAVFELQAGQLVRLTLSIVGKTETELSAASFTAAAASVVGSYILHQAALTLHGSARDFNRATITIDNQVEARFRNSQTAREIQTTGRLVTLATEVPYDTTNADIYTAQAAGTPATGSLVLTSGNRSTTFTFARLWALDLENSEIAARNAEIGLPLTFQALQTGSTKEIVMGNDSTG